MIVFKLFFQFFVIIVCVVNAKADTGILIVAHGAPKVRPSAALMGNCFGSIENVWEARVLKTFSNITARPDITKNLIFTMWSSDCFDKGILKIKNKMAVDGKVLTKLIVVPLFVSSNNTVVSAQKYILGLSSERPKYVPPHISLRRVTFNKKIIYSSSIDDHLILSQILKTRTNNFLRKFKIKAEESELFLIFHGPVSEKDNQLLMMNAWKHASRLSSLGLNRITPISLRDDAKRVGENEIWERAREDFRNSIEMAKKYNHHALVLPVVISLGGIEKGIHERLDGLNYLWQDLALLPDKRLTEYLNQMIEKY